MIEMAVFLKNKSLFTFSLDEEKKITIGKQMYIIDSKARENDWELIIVWTDEANINNKKTKVSDSLFFESLVICTTLKSHKTPKRAKYNKAGRKLKTNLKK